MTRRRKLQVKREGGNIMIEERVKHDREDKGECYFCAEHVYASEGQLLTYFRGKPTHKSCRKA